MQEKYDWKRSKQIMLKKSAHILEGAFINKKKFNNLANGTSGIFIVLVKLENDMFQDSGQASMNLTELLTTSKVEKVEFITLSNKGN